MFLTQEMRQSSEPDDIQELIKSSPRCEASTSADDMEGGRGGSSARGSTSSSSSLPPQPIPPQPIPPSGGCGGSGSFFAKYFSVQSFLLLVLVTALLVILPLVLPPLPPPPSMLMLVPVAMLVLLVVLAFLPTSGGRCASGPTDF